MSRPTLSKQLYFFYKRTFSCNSGCSNYRRFLSVDCFVKPTLKNEYFQEERNGRYFSSSTKLTQKDNSHSLKDIATGPGLGDFIQSSSGQFQKQDIGLSNDSYLQAQMFHGEERSVFIETYGCQMNVNDTEIAWGILQQNGFTKANAIEKADVILAVTCAIREGAETKIWKRLQYFKSLKRKMKHERNRDVKIGVLGCMAERLKHKILEKEKMVDVVCGPDAYRDLPRLLAVTGAGEHAVNVQLSLEETYADVVPVRINADSPSAFVSIMRGCDNMCTYCIVPFTRGRERSRDITSIIEEVHMLSEQNVKEVTLLGQNVNSYRDMFEEGEKAPTQISAGFKTVYKPKVGGRRFAELLEAVARVDPEMRIRYTSPHPKDFPDDVLHVMAETPNICNHIHMPAQSGNSETLKAMGRGYTREAYLELIDHVKSIIPGVSFSSDFIAGFCGETEEAHLDTLSLMDIVKYNIAYTFPYSLREKTRAHRRLVDDVPQEVKNRRHQELDDRFRFHSEQKHKSQAGERHLVLVEGPSKRSALDLAGRNEGNTKVIFPDTALHSREGQGAERPALTGEYVVVEITPGGTSLTLKGQPLYRTTLQGYHTDMAGSLHQANMA